MNTLLSRHRAELPVGVALRVSRLDDSLASFGWIKEILSVREGDPFVKREWDFDEVAGLEFADDNMPDRGPQPPSGSPFRAATEWLSRRSRAQFDQLRERFVNIDVLIARSLGEPPNDFVAQLRRLGLETVRRYFRGSEGASA